MWHTAATAGRSRCIAGEAHRFIRHERRVPGGRWQRIADRHAAAQGVGIVPHGRAFLGAADGDDARARRATRTRGSTRATGAGAAWRAAARRRDAADIAADGRHQDAVTLHAVDQAALFHFVTPARARDIAADAALAKMHLADARIVILLAADGIAADHHDLVVLARTHALLQLFAHRRCDIGIAVDGGHHVAHEGIGAGAVPAAVFQIAAQLAFRLRIGGQGREKQGTEHQPGAQHAGVMKTRNRPCCKFLV